MNWVNPTHRVGLTKQHQAEWWFITATVWPARQMIPRGIERVFNSEMTKEEHEDGQEKNLRKVSGQSLVWVYIAMDGKWYQIMMQMHLPNKFHHLIHPRKKWCNTKWHRGCIVQMYGNKYKHVLNFLASPLACLRHKKTVYKLRPIQMVNGLYL